MAKKGIVSKGIKFYYATYSTGATPTLGSYNEVLNLQAIPSLGGQKDKVEVTTLADEAHQYINGLIEYGDLDFRFLYDNSASTSNYRVIKGLGEDTVVGVKVELPDTTTFTFDAMLSASIDEAEPNQALTFTVRAALQSAITVTNPSA